MNIPTAPTVSLANMPSIDDALLPQPGELRAFGASLLAGLGAGHRSMLPLATQAWKTPQRGVLARVLVTVLAVGELIGDKLPFAPDRRNPLALVERAVTGAIAGYGVAPRGKLRIGRALVGAAAAVAATYAGAALRRQLDRRFRGPLGALAEDAVSFGIAWAAARLARPAIGTRA